MSVAVAGGFASVILDVDSTLCGVEGIDWLAQRAGPVIGAEVSELTERAMRAEIALEAVYGQRLTAVSPTRDDVAALAEVYLQTLAPGAERAVARLRERGRRVVIVSGGIREAILPLAAVLGLDERDVHAVGVHHDGAGAYAGFESRSPLATAEGKRAVAARLALPRRVLAVGDGATDLAMRPAVDAFAAYTGFVRRPVVVIGADLTLTSFDQLVELVLT